MTITTLQVRLANAPCSWGVLEWSAGPAPEYAQVLDEIAATGFAGTELGDWGFMPTDPAALADELRRRGLTMVGAYVPVRLTDASAVRKGQEQAVRTAHLLAEISSDAFIVLADETAADPRRAARAGRITTSDGLDAEGWKQAGVALDELALAVRDETGLRSVLHAHCATFIEAPWEIQAALENTDESLIGLCVDTGHVTYGGGDPVALIRDTGKRVWHVHFKDCSPAVAAAARHQEWNYETAVHNGLFCELGLGTVPFPSVMAALESIHYRGWIVVEQDVLPSMGTPFDSARRNREFLRGLGL
jgi:inosose dehydratase